MDLSDGLADGVRQIADAERRGRRSIDAGALPIDAGRAAWFESQRRRSARSKRSPAATTTSCCSPSPPGCAAGSALPLGTSGVPFTRIGVCTESPDGSPARRSPPTDRCPAADIATSDDRPIRHVPGHDRFERLAIAPAIYNFRRP